MLDEYFSMAVSEDGLLCSLPLVLSGYIPDLSTLPIMLLRLGSEVDWNSEKGCFDSFLREMALFYTVRTDICENDSKTVSSNYRQMLEHILFPAFKRHLMPSSDLMKHTRKIVDLPSLYKVFERC